MPNPENVVGKGRPFPPGVSGNPGGRPKFSDISDALRRQLREPHGKRAPKAKTRAERIAFSMIRRAEKKSKELEVLLDRAEGKVPQAITGADGAALIPAGFEDSAPKLFAMTQEQLEELIRGVK